MLEMQTQSFIMDSTIIYMFLNMYDIHTSNPTLTFSIPMSFASYQLKEIYMYGQ